MRIFKLHTLLVVMLLTCTEVFSQEIRTEIRVDFRVNSTTLDSCYSDNALRLTDISSFVREIKQDSTITLLEVSFCGAASPEGSDQLNRNLARARLETLEERIRREIDIPDSIITRDESYIRWEYLQEQVTISDIPQKQAILDIIAQEPALVEHSGRSIDRRIVQLQQLDGGRVWQQLHNRHFAHMRNACVIFIIYKHDIMPPVEEIAAPSAVGIPTMPRPVSMPLVERQTADVAPWSRHLYLKTNAIGLGLAISNLGIEVDLAKHWSLSIPAYYSAIDYFTPTVKFRTLAVQPELRFWFNEQNQRFFVGAHFGYAQYNIAVNGDIRYQDHDGTSPALGGGLSLGYRLPISKSERWHIEFVLGAGVYGLHYDTFYNVNNGKLIDTHRKTYVGLDNAAINISYRFNLNKRNR